MAAVWTGPEQKNFQKVLDEFDKRTGAKRTFVPTGDSQSTFLGTKIEGGAPPDVAFLAQNGVLHQFADKGWLKPLGPEAQAQLTKNFSPGWQKLGAWKGKQYGIYAKVSNKSLIWYNTAAFSNAGASVPKTWDDFLKTAETIFESGTAPVSIGGADGWTLTDWFENIYLSQAGPEKYDQLAAHKIKWTDPSVKAALTTLGAALRQEGPDRGRHQRRARGGLPEVGDADVHRQPAGRGDGLRGRLRLGVHRAPTPRRRWARTRRSSRSPPWAAASLRWSAAVTWRWR